MIIVVAAIGVFAAAMIWYVLSRGPEATSLTHADFDDAYDDLVAKGEVVDGDRDSAWQDFDAWQTREDRERQALEDGLDE
jgi:hypothetical protein